MRKFRGHIQATQSLRNSHSTLPHCNWSYLCPTSFIARVLLNSHLSLVRHDLGSILRVPIITWCNDLVDSITRVENISTTDLVKRSSLIPSPGVFQTQGIQMSLQSYLMNRLNGRSRGILWGFTYTISISAQN